MFRTKTSHTEVGTSIVRVERDEIQGALESNRNTGYSLCCRICVGSSFDRMVLIPSTRKFAASPIAKDVEHFRLRGHMRSTRKRIGNASETHRKRTRCSGPKYISLPIAPHTRAISTFLSSSFGGFRCLNCEIVSHMISEIAFRPLLKIVERIVGRISFFSQPGAQADYTTRTPRGHHAEDVGAPPSPPPGQRSALIEMVIRLLLAPRPQGDA